MTNKTSLLDEIDQQGSRLAKAEGDLYDLTTALSYAFDGTAKMDADGKYVYVNDLYADNFGYTTKDLQGLPWQVTTVDGDRAAMTLAIEYCKVHGRSEIEAKGLRKDGTVFWKKVALVRLPLDLDKKYQGYYAFVRDVTDSKRWATDLQHSQQRFETLVRANSQIVYVRDVHGFFSEDQPSWEHFTGQQKQDYWEMGWIEAVHEDDRLRITEAWAMAVMNLSLYEVEYRLHRADGEWRDMFTRAAPVLERDGTVREWIGSCEDITEVKLSKQRFEILTDVMPQLVWATDYLGNNTYRNEQWYDYTGQDPNDAYTAMTFLHPEDRPRISELWAQARKDMITEYEVEFRLRRKDGEYRWFLVRGTPAFSTSGEFLYWIGTCTDVHDRHLAAEELAASRARIQGILDASMDAIISITEEGRVIEWNPAATRIFGWTREETMDQKLADFIIPHSFRASHEHGLLRHQKTGEAVVFGKVLEMPALTKDGGSIDTELTIVPVQTEHMLFYTAYLRDVTEKKRTDKSLRLRERTLASATNGIVITDSSLPDEPIIYCNPAFEKLTGYNQEEILGKNCRFIQGPATDKKAVRKLKEAIRDRKTCRVQLLNYRKNGTSFWNDLTISPVLDERGDCTNFIGVQYQVEGQDPINIPAIPHDNTESTTNESS